MNISHLLTTSLVTMAAAIVTPSLAQTTQTPDVLHFDMSLKGDNITDGISGNSYKVTSALPACTVGGLMGQALRFDGYSNFVKAAKVPATMNARNITISLVVAANTYPMMRTQDAEATPTYGHIFGNLDDEAKQGFAVMLSSQGDLQFKFYLSNGFAYTTQSSEKVSLSRWHHIAVTIDQDNTTATLYLDGKKVGETTRVRNDVRLSDNSIMIGKASTDLKDGIFLINTFCGLIDDVAVYNRVLTASDIAADCAAINLSAQPDFNYPDSRYAASLWRPQFHGMPSGGWTNECHGMTYSDGKYHVFFQKNANGPYMARLHWGHITSENLYKWTEEPVAIAPDQPYDLKGCWSGAVYEKDNTPHIIYTAVDNGRATIALATPKSASLKDWDKKGVIINGRPGGLSDDFRDPYWFTHDGKEYIIVGSSKDGLGCCTLHRYENGSWTNDGATFFRATNKAQHGTFWEMPNITDMGNGKWLFTCTPLGTSVGVRTICWTGTIGSDGKFIPDHEQPYYLEMNGISKDGYGLLSPTIYKKDGKTLMLGIVPDKLPGDVNYRMGWAHNYSLPREISLDSDGSLIQKPYSGLTSMRTETAFSAETTLNGALSMAPVSGRYIEMLGEFTVADAAFGFNFLKSGSTMAQLRYDPKARTLTLDFSSLIRQSNDNGPYNGKYVVDMTKTPFAAGSRLKLQVYMDGSIADIFVADRYAFSVRIFPSFDTNVDVEAFAEGDTKATISGWTLDANRPASPTGIDHVTGDAAAASATSDSVYDLAGRQLSAAPRHGMYIAGGKKRVR